MRIVITTLFALAAACTAEQSPAPDAPSDATETRSGTLGMGGDIASLGSGVDLSVMGVSGNGAPDADAEPDEPSDPDPGPSGQPSDPVQPIDMPMAGGGAPEPVDPPEGDVPSPGTDGGLANLLILFDRSQSMGEEWNGEPRWKAAGLAVARALSELKPDQLDDGGMATGAVLFPTPDPDAAPTCVDPTGVTCIFVPGGPLEDSNCMVEPGHAAHIALGSGYDFLDKFTVGPTGAPSYFPIQSGYTPLKEGLLEAQRMLDDATLTGPTAVVVITDGEPNCEWDADVANGIVAQWQAQGIRTHVMGLPGPDGPSSISGADGAGILSDLAVAGGTGGLVIPADPFSMKSMLLSIVRGETP